MNIKKLRVQIRLADLFVISLLSLIMMNSLVEIVEDKNVAQSDTVETDAPERQKSLESNANNDQTPTTKGLWRGPSRSQASFSPTRGISSVNADSIGKNILPSNREKVALIEVHCTSEHPIKLRSPSSLAQIKLKDCGHQTNKSALVNKSTKLEATTFETETFLTSEIISLSKGSNDFTYQFKDGAQSKTISFCIQH